jgi:hypothetical protein
MSLSACERAAVHHVARRDDVRPRARVAQRLAREQLERLVVVDADLAARVAAQRAAVAVIGVLALPDEPIAGSVVWILRAP